MKTKEKIIQPKINKKKILFFSLASLLFISGVWIFIALGNSESKIHFVGICLLILAIVMLFLCIGCLAKEDEILESPKGSKKILDRERALYDFLEKEYFLKGRDGFFMHDIAFSISDVIGLLECRGFLCEKLDGFYLFDKNKYAMINYITEAEFAIFKFLKETLQLKGEKSFFMKSLSDFLYDSIYKLVEAGYLSEEKNVISYHSRFDFTKTKSLGLILMSEVNKN